MKMTKPVWQLRAWRVIALVAGLAIFALIFAYDGFWAAISGGVAAALVLLILSHLSEPEAPDGGI